MATTPPRMLDSARPSTPPAPRLGAYYDDWEPYSCRKSNRIEKRKGSPRKTSASHSSTMKGPSRDQPDELLGKPSDQTAMKKTTTKRNAAMLPTPTKTPRKPATTQQTAEMDSIKRNIFPTIDEEALLADRKSRTNKKISGQSLESFRIEEDDEQFAIFADSCNRIPEQDESNPFYNPSQSKQKSTKKAKMVNIPGEGAIRVEDAAGRADGMLMNFRGKTYFQRFSKPANADAGDTDELALDDVPVLGAKPRLLFAKKQDKDELADDEEADTDVEDDILAGEPSTPRRTKTIKTPNAPRLPESPPATDETTRFQDMMKPTTPAKKAATTQPLLTRFKKWGTVSKAGKSATAGTKRAGPPLDNDAKRARTSDV